MSLSFCVLGSGSGGNATLVICRDATGSQRFLLIDAGLAPRTVLKRARSLGLGGPAPAVASDREWELLSLAQLGGIILTHLDWDHLHRGWIKVVEKFELLVHVHERHLRAARQCGFDGKRLQPFNGSTLLQGLRLEGAMDRGDAPEASGVHPRLSSIILAHDELGSVGFVLEHEGLRLGYATDLGRVPESLYEHFQGLHALAIESNYDQAMQVNSGRPWFLKRRIMGGKGHLSNDQALEAVRRIDQASSLSHVALLHLSRQCNDPDLVRSLYRRRAPELADRLTITHQRWPSPLLALHAVPKPGLGRSDAAPCGQLALFQGSQ